jgi:hypothetical protein
MAAGAPLLLRIELDSAANALIARLAHAPEEFRKAVLLAFDRLAQKAAAWIIRTQLSGGEGLRRRTGSLARSITGRGVIVDGIPAMRVGVFRGPSLAYARIQEFGGRVLPKRAKSLAMPVGDALTPAGVAKWASPLDFPGRLTFVPFRHGRIAIGALYDTESLNAARAKATAARLQARAAGQGGKLNMSRHGSLVDWSSVRKLWVLLKYADIPARHYLLNGMRTFIPQIASELLVSLKAVLNG